MLYMDSSEKTNSTESILVEFVHMYVRMYFLNAIDCKKQLFLVGVSIGIPVCQNQKN